MSEMTPREVVQELDKHIIGQADAKRAVAIALRNRWRRLQLPDKISNEITPKNILMIGPTGVGKTEIARKLAKLANAPFIKVEATKFTEVGYVGKEVDSIIRDLTDIALTQVKSTAMSRVKLRSEEIAEEIILDKLLPSRDNDLVQGLDNNGTTNNKETRQALRKELREGKLDDKEIEIDVSASLPSFEVMAPPGMEEMTDQLQGMFKNLSNNKTKSQKMKIKEAMIVITEQEARKLVNDNEIKQDAIKQVEQNGIVFIDEIDKVASRSNAGGADVSREGVQRIFSHWLKVQPLILNMAQSKLIIFYLLHLVHFTCLSPQILYLNYKVGFPLELSLMHYLSRTSNLFLLSLITH